MDHQLLKKIEEQSAVLRRELHRHPELSNREVHTAARIVRVLREAKPGRIITGIGGHGVAAVFDSGKAGPAVMFRAELDALPISDEIDSEHRSENPSLGHKCGHDGHMAVIAGLGAWFREKPPREGKAILLFQPAEETGEGAQRVLDDPGFESIKPDYAFAFHNIPGYEKHAVILRDGIFAAGSRGFIARLKGSTSHAAHPEQGRNPALAMSQLITELTALPAGRVPAREYALVTMIHARLGEKAFGTSAGYAEVMATFRTYEEPVMQQLVDEAEKITEGLGRLHGLKTDVEWTEVFLATVNDKSAVDMVRKAAAAHDVRIIERKEPFPWSEDFGRFTARSSGVLFGIGSGAEHSDLHSAAYDFPDDITGTALKLFVFIADRLLSTG